MCVFQVGEFAAVNALSFLGSNLCNGSTNETKEFVFGYLSHCTTAISCIFRVSAFMWCLSVRAE